MPTGHRHGNPKEAAGATSQELGLGCRSIFRSDQLSDKVSSRKAREMEKWAQPGAPQYQSEGREGREERAKKPGERQVKVQNRKS